MTYHLITPPAAEPLTLAETKAHLRVDGTEEDDLIAGLISVARGHIERTTGLALISQSWRLYLDGWPEGGVVTIARGPVQSIVAIRVYDELGDESLVALDGHVLDGKARPARLFLRTMPAPGQALNGVEIDFVAGFGEAGADVPGELRRAMLVHIAQMFELRGAIGLDDQPAAIPPGYDRLVAPYRLRRL